MPRPRKTANPYTMLDRAVVASDAKTTLDIVGWCVRDLSNPKTKIETKQYGLCVLRGHLVSLEMQMDALVKIDSAAPTKVRKPRKAKAASSVAALAAK